MSSLSGDDVREGLTAVINLKLTNPQFEGQTKTKLGNSEISGLVSSIVYEGLTEFFEENPTIARKICAKSIDAAHGRWPVRLRLSCGAPSRHSASCTTLHGCRGG